jgi:hypothetical protein
VAGSQGDAVEATESWFVGRGLPHFIFRYSASRDVWTRAAPLLTLVALVEVVVNAPSANFEVWVSVLASIGAVAAVIAVWMVSNQVRRRPIFARPEDVGPVEVALFVILPALVPIVTDGQWRSGLVTGGANLLLVVLIYFATSYGLVPMTRWVVGHGARQILSVSALLVRALPLLLLVVIIVFYTAEPYQFAHELPWPLLALALLLFGVVGVAFAIVRIPRQVGELSQHESWTQLRNRARTTPAAALRVSKAATVPALSRREWINVGLVVLASEGILVALVGVAMFGFLVLLGLLTVPVDLASAWAGAPVDELVSFHLFGADLAVSSELLKTSAFLAGFTSLQFTVSLLSDGTYQEEFLHELREELRDALATRAVYLTVMIRRPRARS